MDSIGLDLCLDVLEGLYLGQREAALEHFALSFAEGTERREGEKILSRKGIAALPGAEPLAWRDVELQDGKCLRLWLRDPPDVVEKAVRMIHALDRLAGNTERLHHVAVSDALTGILNRRGLEEWFEARTNRYTEQAACTIAFLDVDQFKQLNDVYGHDRGDAALKDIAKSLRISAGEQDIVARLGGDEFVVVLEGVVYGSAVKKQLVEMVAALPLRPYSLTVTVGVAGYPQHGSSLRDVLKAADEVMYLGKRHGKNCVMLVEEMARTVGKGMESHRG